MAFIEGIKVLGIAGGPYLSQMRKNGRIDVSKIEELKKQIEELRLNMIKVKEGKSYTDPEVVAVSQELDAVLDKYQEVVIKEANKRPFKMLLQS